MGFNGSFQELAFQIAKRTWLKRTISAASLALTAFTTYHQYTAHSTQTQEQMDRSIITTPGDEGDSTDRAPSSIHSLSEHNSNFRSGDEVFLSRSNQGNTGENNSEEQTDGAKSANSAAGNSPVYPVGTPQYNRPPSARSGTTSGSNAATTDNSASGSSAGVSAAYQSNPAFSNPIPAASPVYGTVTSSNYTVPTSGPSPSVSAIIPAGGSSMGGTAVSITGSNFRSGDSVSLGGSQCLSVQIVSPTQLTCTTSFHSSQSVNVTVADIDGLSAMMASAFDYQPGNTVQAVSFAGSSKTGAYGDIETVSITQDTSVIISP